MHSLLAVLLMLLSLPLQAAGILQLEQAVLLLQTGNPRQAESADWQPVRLPDHWTQQHPGTTGEGWYRLDFDWYGDGEQLNAVYLPRLSMNAAVQLNGVALGHGGSFDEPIGRNWNRPLLLLIPHGLLQNGHNQLLIRLLAPPWTQAMLMPPRIGPESLLRSEYEQAYFSRITLNQSTSLLIAAIGLLMLSLWWRRRKDIAYGLFGLAALLWAAQSTNLFLQHVPLATHAWEVLINASFSVIASLVMASLLLFTGSWRPALRWLLAPLALAAPLTIALAPASHFMAVTGFWHLLTVLATAATLLRLLQVAIQQQHRDARALLLSLGIVLLFALHDWLLHSKPAWLQWSGNETFLLQFAAPLVFFSMAWVMTAHYVRVLNDYEQLNIQLEQRVGEKHQELQDNFMRIERMLKEQAMLEERERIYQDLHDDFGAKLLSLFYRAENPDNAELARSALQDLRDVVSCNSEELGLDILAADWRIECEKRLREAGLTLQWQATSDLACWQLTQPQYLNLGRILREAISNILRHAAASQVQIRLQVQATLLLLEIEDDGQGIAEGNRRLSGRGFANMEKRALRLGGALYRLHSQPHGLTLHVQIPLIGAQHRCNDTGPH